MISWEQCALIILASGRSRRFGDEDKLIAPFCGKPLASHAAQLAKAAPFTLCVSVIPAGRSDLQKIFESHGAKALINHDPDAGQGRSLAIGAEAAIEHNCDAAFIVLADMPLIRVTHLERLRQRLDQRDAVFAFDGQRRSPPALFRKSAFPLLAKLSGDQGAKAVMNRIDTTDIKFSAEDLADIDTADDLQKIEEQLAKRR